MDLRGGAVTYPPFRVSFVEVQRRGLAYAREIIRAAVNAVEARDAEVARLRRHLAALEGMSGSTFTVDNPAAEPVGLWTMHGDRPQRLCTLAPGDRLVVMRGAAALAVEVPRADGRAVDHG